MADIVIVPPDEGVTELDLTEESMNWPQYTYLAQLGYTRAEAKSIMKRVGIGTIGILDVPRKKRR